MYAVTPRILRRFHRDERGVVLILTVLLLVPLLLIVAVVVDYSQTLVVKRQLTSAVDAAALSLGAQTNLDDAEAEEVAETFIKANYPEIIGSLKTFSVSRDGEFIDISATAELDTAFMHIAGFDKLTITVENRIVRKENKLEVVMVLDNTGSMRGAKIDALKVAATTMVDTLFGGEDSSDAVKVGLVPFTATVNVGPANRGASWLDETNPTSLNTENIENDDGTLTTLFGLFDELDVPWGGCLRARPEPFDLTDTPPDPANRDTLFTAYFAPDEDRNDANDYIKTNGNSKRKGNSEYKANKGKFDDANGPNAYCHGQQILPLTNVKSDITSAIDAMAVGAHTVIPEGLVWGWRVVSPTVPFTEGASYDDQATIKAIILLTDGENFLQPGSNGLYKSLYSAFGHAADGHLGNVDGTEANLNLDQKTAQLCDNIKADKDGDSSDTDILLYTVGFGLTPGSNVETLMRNCATDPTKFFSSPSPDDLQTVFAAIAAGLSELRVAR
jgi:Flp pilus assembly protein TadG